ncbi:helix-turn-helix domain-containing protein [Ekhidna sp.]|uniref:helix-turn-helix domain-containing protein n=1 Tax=Ekhidna sp. TaxID=2608089 RepID=UPI00329A18F2
MNVKLNLNILSLSLFSGLLTNWENFDIADLIPEIEQKKILSKISKDRTNIPVSELDTVISNSLGEHSIDEKLDKVFELLESRITNNFKVATLASSMNMTEKSMERWIRKQFNLTPKELLQIVRFQNVSHKLKNQSNRKLIDALEFGYYDQSHFIKECRKITGYSPKEFFSKMKLSTNDIIFE